MRKFRKYTTAKKVADGIFSKFIRMRNASEDGLVQCFTCGKIGHFKSMDCGHFIGRQYMGTRYNEINCQVQCKSCNGYNEGKKYEFGQNLIKKYGESVMDLLEKEKNFNKFGKLQLYGVIESYSDLVKQMKKNIAQK